MSFFRQWCFCVCTVLLVAVVLSLFAPKGSMQKTYKMLLSVFILMSFLYPLREVKTISFALPQLAEETSAGAPYEALAAQEIKRVLEAHQINGADVSCIAQVDYEDGTICLESVQIFVPDDCDITQVHALIYDTLGINAKVMAIGT